MKNKTSIFGIHSNGFYIPKKLITIYLIVILISIFAFVALGLVIPAMLTMCAGLCIFVLTDVLLEQKERPASTVPKRIHTIILCILCGAGLAFCIVQFVRVFTR